MRVLHLLGSNHFSGAENVVCQIISMFRGEAEVDMVYSSPDGQIREALCERGVSYAPISALTVREAKRVIREQKPDVVHAHDMRASLIAALACGKVPLVSHIHGNAVRSRRVNSRTLLYLLTAHRAGHIFWVSESSQRGFVFGERVKKKSSVLKNIISQKELWEKALDADKKACDIVFVGRMVSEKNPQRFIDIIKLIKNEIPNIRVSIFGDGYLADEVKSKIEALGLCENITMHGFVKNPFPTVKGASLMLMCSVSEGMPMCALEALALGVPVVSTPTDGINDIVCDTYNGYLSSSDEVLAKRAVEIIKNRELRDELSKNALMLSDKINNKDKYKAELLSVYAKLTKK